MRVLMLLFILFTCVKVSTAQFQGKNWSKGTYYDNQGNKHAGYLCWIAPDETSKVTETVIYFKNDVKGNELKIDPRSLQRFTIERDSYGSIDSFIVSNNPLFAQKPVIEVLVGRNQVKLYRSLSFVMSKAVRWADGRVTPASKVMHYDYYFGPSDEQLTLLGENNFYESMQAVMADSDAATKMLKNKELAFKDIVSLLYVYTYGGLPPA
ncbi:hypothetical protein CLV59_11517 [Chitinophaga dinghuensis]|uniref:Uncharacterized protein n=1 Tax=Chitinophaga dinghuensis TaxID=1539050 RepID=A0A327VKE0_9BACT|nr:hypothetical protein [Chitinophaga dinghuensis]RAJ72793.1 hypothetical protein CLV59_11517 [Chitinophaga dinghuensis]